MSGACCGDVNTIGLPRKLADTSATIPEPDVISLTTSIAKAPGSMTLDIAVLISCPQAQRTLT
jgi:hypothetical protein